MASLIGIVGPIGAGKDTASDYITDKYGYTSFSFRNIIAELMTKSGIELNRENMQKFAREQRDMNGEDIFSKAILNKILETKCEKALVKELRTRDDVKVLWNHFKKDMKIIKITAPAEIRFNRMKERHRIGDPETLEEFRGQDKKEEELGYTRAFNFTDFIVFNTSDKENLYAQIDKIMSSMKDGKVLTKRRFL